MWAAVAATPASSSISTAAPSPQTSGKAGAASSSLEASARRSKRVPSKANGSCTLCQPTRTGRRCGSRSRST